MVRTLLTLICVLSLSACEEGAQGPGALPSATDGRVVGDFGSEADGSAGEVCVPFEGALAELFEARCASCHGGASPQLGMDLSAGAAYATLVGVAALEAPGTLRVAPGDAEGSYLIAKLGPNPPVGAPMPLGGQLDAADVTRIRAWINGGAVETAADCSGITPEMDQGVGDAGVDMPDSGPLPDAGPPGACVPFEGPVAELLAARCVACHGGAAPQSGLNLSVATAYAALVDVPATAAPAWRRVVPGDPGRSLLFAKLGATPPVGARMPLGGQLTGPEVERIRAWIAGGAVATAEDCGGEPPPPPVEVAEVRLTGPATLGVGALDRLVAQALDADGAPVDLPIAFAVDTPRVLYLDPDGGVLGVSVGNATVRAVAGGTESAPLAVRVVAAAAPEATFLADVMPLLQQRCAVAGCHVDGVEPGDLRFDRDVDRVWDKLVNEAAFQAPGRRRVVPGQPAASYLVEKLSDPTPTVGGRMPFGRPPLAAADAARVVRWILAGATYP